MDEKYVYLNLQQQVGKNKKDIADLWATKFALERAGVRVVGEETSASDLPNPITYPGEYGDAYLVGAEPPFDMYVFTQPSVGETNNKWLNLGPFPAQGPQGVEGPEGPQGPQGDASNWRFGTVNPSILDTDKMHDGYLNTTTGMVYEFDGERWIAIGSIRGPQGVQGPKGDTGAQGIQGAKGDTGAQGPAGIIIEVIGVVDNTGSLPAADTVPRNAGYIVDDGVTADLYIVVSDENDDLYWYDAGAFTGVAGQAATISSATASVVKISMGTAPTATVTLGGTSQNRTFAFTFNLPLPNGDIKDTESLTPSSVDGWTQRIIQGKTFKKVITDLSELFISPSNIPATTQDIIGMMQIRGYSNSCLMIANDLDYQRISDTPKPKGQLVIIQGTAGQNVDVRFIDQSYNVYIYAGSTGNPQVAQWYRLMTTHDAEIVGAPAGGTTGQLLAKKSDDDFDTEWENVPNAPNGTPAGGTTGQILAKKSGTDYDEEWITPPTGVPDGGSTGQMLVKQSNAPGDTAWQTPPTGLPAAGTTGQTLKKRSGTNFDVEWATPNEVPSGGSNGQVLTKTSIGYEWRTPEAGGGGGYSPNILINSDFAINQRGGSPWSSTSSTAKYTVDRWYMRSIGGGNVQVTAFTQNAYKELIAIESLGSGTECLFGQIIDAPYLLGQKVTLSCKVDGIFGYITTTIPSSVPASATLVGSGTINSLIVEIWYDNDSRVNVIFRAIYENGSRTIQYPKLEIGESPTPYVAPDPATEMEKCKYYYEKILQNTPAYNPSSTSFGHLFIWTKEKRITPTIAGSVSVQSGGSTTETLPGATITNKNGFCMIDKSTSNKGGYMYLSGSQNAYADAEIYPS